MRVAVIITVWYILIIQSHYFNDDKPLGYGQEAKLISEIITDGLHYCGGKRSKIPRKKVVL